MATPVSSVASPAAKTVAVIGGGLSGVLFALKLHAARPGWPVLLVEERPRLGRGLAYGDCAPQHLLNVPVSRMEVGLEPRFADWLRQRPGQLAEALDESNGRLEDAFVPRQLFGDYIEQQAGAALSQDAQGGIRWIHGTAAGVARGGIVLADGRKFSADAVVLAAGNLPPRLPLRAPASDRIIADPWAPGALDGIADDAPVLLLGSGLTMVDVALSLRANGHRGVLHAVSRHGLLPRAHRGGGSWPAFPDLGASPLEALRAVRAAVRQAERQGVPWQRVFDALRPQVAAIWHGWSIGRRAQFLRHLRAIWDVHRHRMAARVARSIGRWQDEGVLRVVAGRVLALDAHAQGVSAMLRPRAGRAHILEVGAVVNCTGPQTDLRAAPRSLLCDLVAEGVVRSDPLGLGIESEDCAAIGADGRPSDWLYALGPLTRPAWWEIVAVPEINAQIDRLVGKLSEAPEAGGVRPLAAIFLDIGAGI